MIGDPHKRVCNLRTCDGCNRCVTAVTDMCFCFLQGGPSSSSQAGGGALTENSISLRPAGLPIDRVSPSRGPALRLGVRPGRRLPCAPSFSRLTATRQVRSLHTGILAANCPFGTIHMHTTLLYTGPRGGEVTTDEFPTIVIKYQ